MRVIKSFSKSFLAAVLRVIIIFILLTIASDSLSTLWYTYAPMRTWLDFRSVQVVEEDGEAMVKIDRSPTGSHLSIVERVLFVFSPTITRVCSVSSAAVVDEATTGLVRVPLGEVLSRNCPDLMPKRQIEGSVQISYILNFPRGVQRVTTKHSNKFFLSYAGGRFVVRQSSQIKRDHEQ